MNTCPNCEKEVSEEMNSCPACGQDLSQEKQTDHQEDEESVFCTRCGTKFLKNAGVCPTCGLSLNSEATDETKSILPVFSPKQLKRIIISAIAIVIVIIAGIVVKVIVDKNIEAQYVENLKTTANEIIDSTDKIYWCGHLFESVWNNSIYKKNDTQTDKYTLNESGLFYDDFNAALTNLYLSSDYTARINEIKASATKITELIENSKNPPYEYEEAYSILVDLYNEYINYEDFIVNPSGNFNSFSATLDLNIGIKTLYNKLQYYIR